MAGNDFVYVRLTAAGAEMAGGNELRYSGRTSIVFKPGESVRIARYEWDLQLSSYQSSKGNLFELVPEVSPSAPIQETTEEENK